MANILVELQSGNGVPIGQTVTSNEGDYAFSGLAGGSFTVTVNDSQYESFAERAEFTREASTRPGSILRVDITLVPRTTRHSETRGGVIFHQDVPDTAVKAHQLALRLFSERKSEEGISALRQAIKLFPDYFDAHFALGLEMFHQHRYEDSTQELEKARLINPRDSRLYHIFGLVLYEKKKYATAVKVFEACEQLDPHNAEVRLMRGAALIDLGQLPEAESELKDAERLSAHKLDLVHLQLARIYEKRGDRARAANELEEYLKKSPDAKNAQAIRDAIRKLRI
jgi:tetratricopeptide (TPR) repeat protein